MSGRAKIISGSLALSILLAGCATSMSAKDIRALPAKRMVTQVKLNEVAQCLRNNLGDDTSVVTYPDGRVEIGIGNRTSAGQFDYVYLVSLTGKADGTSIELRKTDAWFPQLSPHELDAETKACARI
jgi:hypothetical protein